MTHLSTFHDIPTDWYYADSLKNYTFVFPFEVAWDRRQTNDWVRRNWSLSVWASVVYVLAILAGERLMRYKKRPFELRGALTAWNWLLAAFSILGFVRTSPEFFRTLTRHGFVHSVCQSTYAQDIVFDFWLVAFVGSKFVELFDTAFIVLRRRPLTFLHCYHHVTVLIYCWHGGKELTAAGRWFCWMNYGVHSVMYTYYAVRSLGFRIPRPVSISVTSLQLTQMITGCCIVYTVYTTKWSAWNRGLDSDTACHQSWDNLYFCFAIYFSYFCLFLRFFVRAYVLRPAKKVDEVVLVVPAKEKEEETGNNNSIENRPCPVCENESGESKNELRRRRGKQNENVPEFIIEKYYTDKPHIFRKIFASPTQHG